MNIKIIHDQVGNVEYAISANEVLLTVAHTREWNDYLPFRQVHYYIYHVNENVREEILPSLDKYEAAEILHRDTPVKWIYFMTADTTTYPQSELILYRYNLKDHTCQEIHRFEDNVKLYSQEKKLQIFVLNDNYLLLQQARALVALDGTKYFGQYDISLMDVGHRMLYPIRDERWTMGGIAQLITVATNVCAVRLGFSLTTGDLFSHLTPKEAAEEYVAMFSVTQMINNVVLNLPYVAMEIVDQVRFDKTLMNLSLIGRYLVYSRRDRNQTTEEIMLYQIISKESIMMINKLSYDPGAIRLAGVGGEPMILRKTEKGTLFYSILRKKNLYSLGPDTVVLHAQDKCLLVQQTRHRLISARPEYYFELLSYPEKRGLYRLRISQPPENYRLTCLTPDADTYLVFLYETQQEESHDE